MMRLQSERHTLYRKEFYKNEYASLSIRLLKVSSSRKNTSNITKPRYTNAAQIRIVIAVDLIFLNCFFFKDIL